MNRICAWCDECLARAGKRPGHWCSIHRSDVRAEVLEPGRGIPPFACEHEHPRQGEQLNLTVGVSQKAITPRPGENPA